MKTVVNYAFSTLTIEFTGLSFRSAHSQTNQLCNNLQKKVFFWSERSVLLAQQPALLVYFCGTIIFEFGKKFLVF